MGMEELSAASLKALAQKALRRYKDGTQLNQAVIATLRGRDLTTEQIKRVVEETNVAAYLNDFGQAGEKRNVVFSAGPADPQVILKELGEGGGDSVPVRPEMSTDKTKVASAVSVSNSMMAEAGEKTKTAAATAEAEAGNVYDGLLKQASLLCRRASKAESFYQDSVAQLVGAVKLAQACGSTGSDIRVAVSQSARTPWGANLALQEIDRYLNIGQGVKTAGRLEGSHPLVQAVRDLEKNGFDLKVSKRAMRETEGEIDNFLQSLSGGML